MDPRHSILYLASPYSHPDSAVRAERYAAAKEATARLIHQGINVFSPIVHSHRLAEIGLPGDWEFWFEVNQAYLRVCAAVIVLQLDGWDQSKGVAAEVSYAKQNGMPILYLLPDSP